VHAAPLAIQVWMSASSSSGSTEAPNGMTRFVWVPQLPVGVSSRPWPVSLWKKKLSSGRPGTMRILSGNRHDGLLTSVSQARSGVRSRLAAIVGLVWQDENVQRGSNTSRTIASNVGS
jgi:hypothetical protein